jgi:hypothetical protein
MKEKMNNQKVARAVADSIMAEVSDRDVGDRQRTETRDRNGDPRHWHTQTQTQTGTHGDY